MSGISKELAEATAEVLIAEIKKLQSENEKLVKCVEFYANKKTYQKTSEWVGSRGGWGDEDDLKEVTSSPVIEKDGGELARQTLKEVGKL